VEGGDISEEKTQISRRIDVEGGDGGTNLVERWRGSGCLVEIPTGGGAGAPSRARRGARERERSEILRSASQDPRPELLHGEENHKWISPPFPTILLALGKGVVKNLAGLTANEQTRHITLLFQKIKRVNTLLVQLYYKKFKTAFLCSWKLYTK
jgi:hypothetical protein